MRRFNGSRKKGVTRVEDGDIMSSMKKWLKPKESFVFPFLAFAIPSVLRAIPEVLMGPYVVGFDTMAHYVPTTLLWLKGNVDFWRYVATAPLFYAIVVSMVLSGGPLIIVLKVLPPLLHGFLGLSIYAYAKSGLGWSIQKERGDGSPSNRILCSTKDLVGPA